MINSTVSRSSMWGGILHIKQMGFAPKTVIDVGAALGTFPLYEIFPQAHHILIEPVAENEPYLEKICQTLANAECLIAAATSQPGMITLEVAPELVHSSASVAGARVEDERYSSREVLAVTVDQLCAERRLEPPYLLKIDVDGNEVDVLMGASEALKQTEYAIIEVSLFNQIHLVIEAMQAQGFVIYDILDLACRPGDQALWQADMAFVKADGQFRQNKAYMLDSDQAKLSQSLQTYRETYIARIEADYGIPDQTSLLEKLAPKSVNWIAFPDWNQSEEILIADLVELLKLMANFSDLEQLRILVDTTDAELETVNLAFSSAAMLLFSETGLDIQTHEPLVMLPALKMTQWQSLLSHLTARIELSHNNRAAIAMADAQDLKTLALT